MSEEQYEGTEEIVDSVEATPAYSESEAPQMLTDDGNFNEDWVSALPDDLGQHSIWNKYTNPIDLAKGAIHSQSLTGQKITDFMESDDPVIAQQRQEMLGIPDSPDQYTFELPEAPEGYEVDDGKLEEFADVAHMLGLSNEQAEALVQYDLNRMEEFGELQQREIEMEANDAEQELRSVWQGDDFDYNLSKVAETLDYLDMGEFKDDPAIGNNPALIQAIFEKIVPLVSDDAIIAQKNATYSTIEDSLREIEQQMYEYSGQTHDGGYQKLMKERGELLAQQAKMKPSANFI